MKPRTILAATIPLVSFVFLAPIMAQADSFQQASALGTIIASEGPCALAYDQNAIGAWIADNTDPADMTFPSLLDALTGGVTYSIQGMSQSALTAHCASVTRSARHAGFID